MIPRSNVAVTAILVACLGAACVAPPTPASDSNPYGNSPVDIGGGSRSDKGGEAGRVGERFIVEAPSPVVGGSTMCLDVQIKSGVSNQNYPFIASNDAQFSSGGSFSEMVNFAQSNDADFVAMAIEGKTGIDALIVKVSEARSRDELKTATSALDRVLRAGHYWVPHWYRPYHYIAYWDKYGRPEVKPRYERGIIHTWWFDAAKAAKLKSN